MLLIRAPTNQLTEGHCAPASFTVIVVQQLSKCKGRYRYHTLFSDVPATRPYFQPRPRHEKTPSIPEIAEIYIRTRTKVALLRHYDQWREVYVEMVNKSQKKSKPARTTDRPTDRSTNQPIDRSEG